MPSRRFSNFGKQGENFGILILTSVYAIIKSNVGNTGIIDAVLSVGWKQLKLWHIVLVVVICLIGYGLYSKT